MADFCSYFRIETEGDITLNYENRGGYREWKRYKKKVAKDSLNTGKYFPGKLLDGTAGSSKGSDGWISYKSDDGVLFTFRCKCPVTGDNEASYQIDGDEHNTYKVEASSNNSSSEDVSRFKPKMPAGGHPVHCLFKVKYKEKSSS